MKAQKIKLSLLVGNTGQIEGLPKNPRKWNVSDVDTLVASIRETPELAQARPMIVKKHGAKYVVLGGNLRLAAWRKMDEKEADCFVINENTTVEKMKEIVLKDNASFGEWDVDELANAWDGCPLKDWGVDVAGLDDVASYVGTNTEFNTSEWKEDMTLKLHFTEEEISYVRQYFDGKDVKSTILNLLGYDGNEY